MGDPVVMLSLYPEFPKDVMSSMTSHGEFLFVVDRSGSMECPMHLGSGSQDRISSARETLLLLLKSLPMGCYFNIIGFGSSYESFFPKSVEYSQKTMDEALQKVKEMRADLGGTEILQPLKHIYSQPCLPDQPRQVSNTPYIPYSALDREAQQSKALHFSARGVTTDPGSIPGCIIGPSLSRLAFGRVRPSL
nr:von Willebrand factor A domain-containing protein 5A-like [Oncorhynchus nerka]